MFAGLGYWEDTAGFASTTPDPNLPGAQVLRLDAPDGGWQVELGLDDFVTSGPSLGQRVEFAIGALQSLTMTTDGNGQALPSPVRLLAAATWAHAKGLHVHVRSADNPNWVTSVLDESIGAGNVGRAFGTHVDTQSGVCDAFTGSDVGIFPGVYDPDAGTIAWSQQPEAWYSSASEDDTPPLDAGWRVMAFSECRGALYASVGPSIYQRQDGPSPSWKAVYTASFPPGYNFSGNGGLRGATCLARDGGDQLFMAIEGDPASLIWVDPGNQFAATTDVTVEQVLSSAWDFQTYYILMAYNDVLPATDPVTGEPVVLIGFEATAPSATVPVWSTGSANFIASANYLVRHLDGSYSVHTIDAPALGAEGTPTSVPHATRTMALSPFPQDHGSVVYAGGFDCDDVPSHDTAWAAVADLGVALGH
jgi:hypothetical protein